MQLIIATCDPGLSSDLNSKAMIVFVTNLVTKTYID